MSRIHEALKKAEQERAAARGNVLDVPAVGEMPNQADVTMSKRMNSLPRWSASCLASSVLPTPVGPVKRKQPAGWSGWPSPARARLMAMPFRPLSGTLVAAPAARTPGRGASSSRRRSVKARRANGSA